MKKIKFMDILARAGEGRQGYVRDLVQEKIDRICSIVDSEEFLFIFLEDADEVSMELVRELEIPKNCRIGTSELESGSWPFVECVWNICYVLDDSVVLDLEIEKLKGSGSVGSMHFNSGKDLLEMIKSSRKN